MTENIGVFARGDPKLVAAGDLGISSWFRRRVNRRPVDRKKNIMSFRTNLQDLRSQRNVTQERLAMLVGVSRQAVSKWESDKAYPEMDKILAICDLFGCTLDDLVLGDVRRPGSGRHDDSKAQGLAGRDDGAPDQPEAVPHPCPPWAGAAPAGGPRRSPRPGPLGRPRPFPRPWRT